MDNLVYMQFKQLTMQITTSLHAMLTTGNPETLFSRREFGYQRIKELSELEKYYNYRNSVLNAQYLYNLYKANDFYSVYHCYTEYMTRAFANLKTDSGIQKRLSKFWEVVGQYSKNVNQLKAAIEQAPK